MSIRPNYFTARRYASAVYAAIVCPSVHLSIRPSVTSRSSMKTAKASLRYPRYAGFIFSIQPKNLLEL